MKKTFSIVLALIMALSCLSVAGYAAEKQSDLKIAVASDLHYNPPRASLDGEVTLDDEIYFYGNRRAAMEDESGFIIDEFLKQCAEDDSIEYVLIPGDLADDGKTRPQDHKTVAAKLQAFEALTGKQVYIVNGNHDNSTDTNPERDETSSADFREIYWNFGYGEALESTFEEDGSLSYTVNLGEKYRLIAADSCDPSVSTEDGLTFKKVTWICNMAEKAYNEGRYPVLMMHHNVLDHMPLQRIVSHNFIVRTHNLTAERLANAGIKTVLTGHEHGSDAITYTSLKGNKLTDFSTTSLTMYPLEYRVMTFTDDEIGYEAKSVDKIDTQALKEASPFISEKSLEMMNEDMDAYALGFLKAGVKYRLQLSLSMEKMGIKEDAIYYNLVNTAVGGLLKILEMPLYGENSASKLAKEYNITIPQTDYENGWDLALTVLSYHYSGNEPFDLDSKEVEIVLKLVDLILLDSLSTTNDRVFLLGANTLMSVFGTEGICKELTKAATKIFGPATIGESFLVALASPLLYGLAYDRDGLDDNNGTIDGYAVTGNNASNVFAKITTFFEKVMLYVSFFFKYIFKAFSIKL